MVTQLIYLAEIMLLIVRKINHELAIAGQIRPLAKVPYQGATVYTQVKLPPLIPPWKAGLIHSISNRICQDG